jgi:hypothetical protein
MIRLQVDFNDLDDDGRVLALRRIAPRAARDGERAYMLDDEGNRCWGTIAGGDGGLIYIDADWLTWTTVQNERHEPQGWWRSATVVAFASTGFSATTVRGLPEAPPQNSGDAPTLRKLPPLVPSA